MCDRETLSESIAETIADYRTEDGYQLDSAHVEQWVNQFDDAVQEPILTELDYVLKETYYSKARIEEFLSGIVKHKKFAGNDPCEFWKTIKFLDIQHGGNSQTKLLELFGSVLSKECGLTISECGLNPAIYVYLDDAIFTGNRVRSDLISWIQSDAPQTATIRVGVIALHSGGKYYADTKLTEAITASHKRISIGWWRAITIEDRNRYIDTADVLRPTCLPDDALTADYVAKMKYPPTFRTPGNVGENKFFSSENGRDILEQEFLKAGVHIRSVCPLLNQYQRPLGNMILDTLGFGSLFVTYRNCPNNCPLVFWAGNPWYPLFPRKTN